MDFARLMVAQNLAASRNAHVRQIAEATAFVTAVEGGAKLKVALRRIVVEATARLTAGARSALFQAATTGSLVAVCVPSMKSSVQPLLYLCDDRRRRRRTEHGRYICTKRAIVVYFVLDPASVRILASHSHPQDAGLSFRCFHSRSIINTRLYPHALHQWTPATCLQEGKTRVDRFHFCRRQRQALGTGEWKNVGTRWLDGHCSRR